MLQFIGEGEVKAHLCVASGAQLRAKDGSAASPCRAKALDTLKSLRVFLEAVSTSRG